MLRLLGALLVPYIAGAGWQRLRKEKERSSPGQSYLMGVLGIFAVAQLSSFAAVKARLDLSGYMSILAAGTAALCVISLAIGRKSLMASLSNEGSIFNILWVSTIGRSRRHLPRVNSVDNEGEPLEDKSVGRYKVLENMGKKESSRIRLETVIILAALIMICATVFLEKPDTGSSSIAESVITTVRSGLIHTYNPLTGGLMERGIYPVYKLHSLPLFYSALAAGTGIEETTLVFRILPVWVIFVSLSAMMLWGEMLSRGMKERKALFLMFYTILLLFRGGIPGTYAYAATREAFKGKGLLVSVLVPLFFCGIYLIKYQGERLYGGAMSALSLISVPFAVPVPAVSDIKSLILANNTEWFVLILSVMVMVIMWNRSGTHWRQADVAFVIVVILFAAIPGSVMAYVGLAFGLTRICDTARDWGRRRAVYIGFIVIIGLYGTVIPFRSPQPKLWERDTYEDGIMADIYAAVGESASGYGEGFDGEAPVVLAQEHLMERCRLEGRNVRTLYGKDMWYENCSIGSADEYLPEDVQLFNLMKTDYLDPDLVADKAGERGVNVLVLRALMGEEIREKWGYGEPVEGPGYALYVR